MLSAQRLCTEQNPQGPLFLCQMVCIATTQNHKVEDVEGAQEGLRIARLATLGGI